MFWNPRQRQHLVALLDPATLTVIQSSIGAGETEPPADFKFTIPELTFAKRDLWNDGHGITQGKTVPAGVVYLVGGTIQNMKAWIIGADGRPVHLVDGSHPIWVSPDLTRLVYSDWTIGHLVLADLVTGDEVKLPGVQLSSRWPAKPNDLLNFATYAGHLYKNEPLSAYLQLIDIYSGLCSRLVDIQYYQSLAFEPSPDGETIAIVVDGDLWLYRLGGGAKRLELGDFGIHFVGGVPEIGGLAWSPNGQRLAFYFKETSWIVVLDPGQRSARLMRIRMPWNEDDPYISWSHDGSWLVFAMGDGNLWALPTTNENRDELYLGPLQPLAISPEKKWMLVSCDYSASFCWIDLQTWEYQSVEALDEEAYVVDWIELHGMP